MQIEKIDNKWKLVPILWKQWDNLSLFNEE